MKKAFFVVVITTAFALTSFAEKSIQPFITAVMYDPAFPFNDSYTDNYDGFVFYNPCTNEEMTLSGSAKIMFHGVYNGEKSTSFVHFNVQGIKAVGESGTVYHSSAVDNSESSFSYNNGVYSVTAVYSERWTTAGGGNNYTFRSTYTLTIDANGNWTVKRDHFEVSCQ